MNKILLENISQKVLVAAIQGYTTANNKPVEAVNKALELVRALEKRAEIDADFIKINPFSDIEKIESEIGRKLEGNESYDINVGLNSGKTAEEILILNPQLKSGNKF